ncbi:hypothetical protein BC830DRAFT_1159973 [Chytriomyces sp. MP71]|nr:hypothetical protein BC830DRAFT_1159973 [Chytriomyces sp. MP71]
MGGGRTQPDPPVNWQSDPTLNFTGDSGPVPPGVGKGCFIAPQLTLGTPLDPQRILACAPGFYCANLNQSQAHTLPVSCPASPGCIAYRLTGFPCSVYLSISYFFTVYCTMFKCPAGYFCPTGTVTPHRCNFLSSCPKGSTYETVYLWLIIIGIIDGVLIVIWAAYTLKRFQLASTMKRLRHLSRSTTPRSNDALEPNDLPLTTISRRSAIPIEEPNTENLRHDLTLLKDAFQAAFPLHGQVRVNFRFEGLELVLRDGRRVLGGVTGKIREGRMTAIIGPSGAGKTTFMNVLMGKVSKTGGKIFINGRESQMHLYRKVIGYVPQEDVMMKELTVRENVLHSARVRLPRTWTSTQIERHVDNVVNALKLSHVASSVIGDEAERGVSGGQRKRVNIGMELAAAPLAIFLDEPTSGLDSSSALEVADILSSMALLGITIVAVVHQPRIEIFRKFDDVIMVAPGGRVAFMGPVDRVQGYFESLGFKFEDATNVSDVAMDILAGRGTNAIVGPLTPDQVVELYVTLRRHSQNQEFHRVMPGVVKERGASFFRQVMYCHNRSLVQQGRRVNALILEIVVAVFAGVLMGISTQGKVKELYTGFYTGIYKAISPRSTDVVSLYCFLVGLAIALASAPSGVKVFGEEKHVYWREAASGHSRLAYFLGKTFATLFRIIITSLHFTAFYMILAKPIISPYMQYYVIALQYWGVYGLSCIISMVVKRENASLLAVVMCLFASVFCGYGPSITQAKAWHLNWIMDLSFNKWAAEAMYASSVNIYKSIYDVELAVSQFGWSLNQVPKDLICCFLIGLIARVAAFFLLIFLHRDKQR